MGVKKNRVRLSQKQQKELKKLALWDFAGYPLHLVVWYNQ